MCWERTLWGHPVHDHSNGQHSSGQQVIQTALALPSCEGSCKDAANSSSAGQAAPNSVAASPLHCLSCGLPGQLYRVPIDGSHCRGAAGSSRSERQAACAFRALGAVLPAVPLLGTEELQIALDVVAAAHSVVDAGIHLLEAAGEAGAQVRPGWTARWRAQLLQSVQLLLQQAGGRAPAVAHGKVVAVLLRQLCRLPGLMLWVMLCAAIPTTDEPA